MASALQVPQPRLASSKTGTVGGSQREAPEFNADLLLVGAGPSGMVAALSAVRSSKVPLKVMLLDQYSEWTRPQTVMLRPGTLRRLKALGIDVNSPPFSPIDHTGGTSYLEGKAKKWMGARVMTRILFRRMVCISDLQKVLAGAIEEAGSSIELKTGWTAGKVSIDGKGVTVDVTRPDGSASSLRSKFLVGADGAHSHIRDELNIPVVEVSPKNLGVVGKLKEQMVPGIHIDRMEIDGERVRAIRLANDTGTSLSIDLPASVAAKSDAAIRDLYSRVGHRIGLKSEFAAEDFVFEPHPFVGQLTRAKQVTSQGRAFLAGDAARTVVVATGMGTNLAISDGAHIGDVMGTLMNDKASRLSKKLSILRYSAKTQLSTRLAHEFAETFSLQHPSEPDSELPVAQRQIKVRPPGAKSFQISLDLHSSLPTDRLWAELISSMTDSSQKDAKLWVHELEQAKSVESTLRQGGDWSMRYLGKPPVFYRMARFDPKAHVLSYRALEGHPLTGGGDIEVVPEGAGSKLTWTLDYSGPWMMRTFTQALAGYVHRRLEHKLRQIEGAADVSSPRL